MGRPAGSRRRERSSHPEPRAPSSPRTSKSPPRSPAPTPRPTPTAGHPRDARTASPATAPKWLLGHWTDQDGDPVDLDTSMRAHAHVEDHIRRLKDSGLCRFPFTDLDANRAWLATVCFAADLVRWFQLVCVTAPLARAEPETLRWRLWHAPPGSSTTPDETSSASSTAGPTRRRSSPPTSASPPSADRRPQARQHRRMLTSARTSDDHGTPNTACRPPPAMPRTPQPRNHPTSAHRITRPDFS
jgi:Transposase DDE domain group 1